MAVDIKQRIKVQFERVKRDLLADAGLLKRAGEAAAAVVLDLIRQRTNAGVDENGQPFRSYSPRYGRYTKPRYIAGKGSLAKNYKPIDRFSAQKVRDVGRLSGRFFAGFSYKDVKVRKNGSSFDVEFSIGLDTRKGPRNTPSAAEKDSYLRRMGYKIFGMARSGPWKKKQDDAIRRIIKQYLRLNRNASSTITEV